VACSELPPNCPYIKNEIYSNTFFSTIWGAPNTFDPQLSYSAGEAGFLSIIYEPLMDYHYLKRPYVLEPLTCMAVPDPIYYDSMGNTIPEDSPIEIIHKVEYRFELKRGISFQEHPCFAKDENGNYLYHNLSYEDAYGIRDIGQFKHTGTRELTADDYIYGLYRLADPRTNCPIIGNLKQYIYNFESLNEALREHINVLRKQRKAEAGALYNQERDERAHPLQIDRLSFPFEGVKKHGRYSFSVYLRIKYPAFIYLISMLFFSPIPWEAETFYDQGPLIQQNVTLNRYPVGTGPFCIQKLDPNEELILLRNEHYHHGYYPTEGEPTDQAEGLLDDAGKPLPFIDRAIYKLEKEPTSRWTKFIQGYYDLSGIPASSFDQVVNLNTSGGTMGVASSQYLEEEDIQLFSSPTLTIWYYAFNNQDDIWGGLDERGRKLRQAVSIALDLEEYLIIFQNGIGKVAQSPIPPNIPGYEVGKEGVNPVTHVWDPVAQEPVRRPIEDARQLLAEAGYPGGYDSKGNQLVLHYDSASSNVNSAGLIWMRKQLARINVRFEPRISDWDRLMDKVESGSFQFYHHGWNADYPDPDNFLFLFDCLNYTDDFTDEDFDCNKYRYNNPEYNALFLKLKHMERGPERTHLVQRCVEILQRDAPWIFGYFPYDYFLVRGWVSNVKPRLLGGNMLKFLRLDYNKRYKQVLQDNQPIYYPFVILVFLLILLIAPVVIAFRLREQGKL